MIYLGLLNLHGDDWLIDFFVRIHEISLMIFFLFQRPEFCPINQIGKPEEEKLPKNTQERGVDTGAAIFVESCDGKVLIVRRALHLRTFPGIWVPPGGHLEVGEQVCIV